LVRFSLMMMTSNCKWLIYVWRRYDDAMMMKCLWAI
jgi:hypothetical protein